MIEKFDHDTALVVIDPQVGVDMLKYWGGVRGRRNNPRAEANLASLLGVWRDHGLPVVFTRHESLEARSPLRADAPTCRFKDGLEPRIGEQVVTKSVNGAFFGTDLEMRLRRLVVRRLVVVGFFTNMCVETTVRTAGNFGYDTYLGHDACSTTNRVGPDGVDHDPAVVHATSVASMHGEFCTALTTAQLMGLCACSDESMERAQGNEP